MLSNSGWSPCSLSLANPQSDRRTKLTFGLTLMSGGWSLFRLHLHISTLFLLFFLTSFQVPTHSPRCFSYLCASNCSHCNCKVLTSQKTKHTHESLRKGGRIANTQSELDYSEDSSWVRVTAELPPSGSGHFPLVEGVGVWPDHHHHLFQ